MIHIYFLIGLLLWMLFGFFCQEKKKDMGLVDVFWALGIGLAVFVLAFLSDGNSGRRFVVAAIVFIWALRLSSHLFLNRVYKKKEDARYAHLRSLWGDKASRYFLFIFLFEAFLIFLFVFPFFFIFDLDHFWNKWDIVAVLWAVTCVSGEALADRQLEIFKKISTNKKKTCNVGLWKYSRHPNYFFEWLFWFSFVFFTSFKAGFIVTFLSPVVMLIFLFWITGIPYTEKQALKSRGDDYREYQRTTSVFIPWFVKK